MTRAPPDDEGLIEILAPTARSENKESLCRTAVVQVLSLWGRQIWEGLAVCGGARWKQAEAECGPAPIRASGPKSCTPASALASPGCSSPGRTVIRKEPLVLPGRTVIRKELLGPDAERRVRHEVAVPERLRGVAGVARQLAGAPRYPGVGGAGGRRRRQPGGGGETAGGR